MSIANSDGCTALICASDNDHPDATTLPARTSIAKLIIARVRLGGGAGRLAWHTSGAGITNPIIVIIPCSLIPELKYESVRRSGQA